MRYLLIDRGTIAVKNGSLKLGDLQQLVGGLICGAFWAESADRPGYELAGYVNDEGFGVLPPNVRGVDQVYWGSVVVTGVNPHGGTCELTEAEVAHFRTMRVMGEPLPRLIVDRLI